MTPSGIEPATFRFVAQHLNHCATAVPHVVLYDEFLFTEVIRVYVTLTYTVDQCIEVLYIPCSPHI